VGGTDFSNLSDDHDLWGDDGGDPPPERPLALPPHLDPLAGVDDAGRHTCDLHPDRGTDTACASCRKWVCRDCRLLVRGKVLCNACRVEDRWRTPLLLRLSGLTAWLVLGSALLHRHVASVGEEAVEAKAPLFPPEQVPFEVPAFVRDLDWAQLSALDHTLNRWSSIAAIAAVVVGAYFLRGSEGQTWRVGWRVLVIVAFCGAGLVLHSDAATAVVLGEGGR